MEDEELRQLILQAEAALEALANERSQDIAEWRKEYTKTYIESWVCTEQRLKPMDAFMGGRTNVIQHLVENLEPGYRLGYFDFTSLYPSVNFSAHGEEWPLGPPDVFIGSEVENAPDLEEAFGLWKVDVLPPKHLRHPVLGQAINDKLVFHLCSLCARKSRQGYCKHKNKTRMIKKGTFFSGELQLAVSKGYLIMRVYEVWNWPTERRTTELFRSLIRDQYAKKVYASGAPADPTELQHIIDEHWTSMGLRLDPAKFRKDPAMRALAKFSLNNM
jgi:predicted transposase YbfD/YdcC